MKKLLTGGLLFSLGAFSSALIVVDDFTTGAYDYETKTVGTTVDALQSGNMLGLTRLVSSLVTSNPLARSKYTISIGDGLAIVENGPGLTSETKLAYGYIQGQNGFELADLNKDFSVDNLIKLDFAINERDLTLVVGLRSSGQNNGNWLYKTCTVSGGYDTSGFVYNVALTDFTGFNLADVDQLSFTFANLPAGDFALNSVTAVPEPSLIGGLLVAASLVSIRRARRKS